MSAADSERALREQISALKAALEDYRVREANFLILQETVLDLANRRETGSILRAIVSRARQFARSDFCYLSVRDEMQGDFYALTNEGGVTPFFATVRISNDQGILSKVISTSAPFFTSDYHNDERFIHDSRVDAAMLAEGIISVLGVPLLIENVFLGVFFVADRRVRIYQPGEIAMLSSLAAHAALALESARLLDDAHTANTRSEQQRLGIAAAAAAHEQMTDLVAHGASPESLAALLANLLSGRVTVLDPASRVMCEAKCSEFPDVAETPPDYIVRSALGEAHNVRRAVLIQGWSHYRIVPVIGGGELLGGLMLYRGEENSSADIRTLERAAIVMGIVLLSQERRLQRAHREANELIGTLLGGERSGSDVESEAALHGLETAKKFCLMLVDGPITRTGQGVNELQALFSGKAYLVGNYRRQIAAFLPSKIAQSVAMDIIDRLKREGVTGTLISISKPIPRLATISLAYRTNIQMLALAEKLGIRDNAVTEDQMGLYATMFEGQNSDQIQAFIQAMIGPLLKRDKTTSSDLAGTLLTYMDHGHSVRAAASVMRIHTNTLRQRLETVSTLLPEWGNPTTIFDYHAALRLHHLCRVLPMPNALPAR